MIQACCPGGVCKTTSKRGSTRPASASSARPATPPSSNPNPSHNRISHDHARPRRHLPMQRDGRNEGAASTKRRLIPSSRAASAGRRQNLPRYPAQVLPADELDLQISSGASRCKRHVESGQVKSGVLNSNQRIMRPTEFSIEFHKLSQFGQNDRSSTSSCLECAGRQCARHAAVQLCVLQT